MTLRMVMLAVSLVNHVVPIPQLNSPPPHDSVSLSSVSVSDQGNANCLRLMSFLFYVMAYTFFMQQADSFLLSFFLSAYSPCSLVQVQRSGPRRSRLLMSVVNQMH